MTISLPPKGNDAKVLGSYFAPLKVTALATPEMRVMVAEGAFWTADNEHQEFIGGISPTISAPGSLAKWVLLTVTPNGALNLIDGVADATPELPDVSLYKDELPLAAIFVGDTVTAITTDMVYDIRPMWQIPPDSVSQSQLTDFATITYVDNGLATKAETDGTGDANFTLNVGGGSINDSGIYIDRQAGPDVAIRFNELATSGSPAVLDPQWEFTNDGSTWNAIGVSSGSYYLKTELNAGALDFLYYRRTELNSGPGTSDLDSRYYEQAVADAAFADIIHTHVKADITDLNAQVETVNSIPPTLGDVSLNINDILDVYNVATANTQTLVYNTSNLRFENRFLNTDDLEDVDTTTVSPSAGEVMIYSGAKFTNRTLLKTDISDLVESDYVLVAGTNQDVFGVKTFKDGVVIETSLTVTGSNTTIETTTLTVSDDHIDLNYGETGDGVGNGSGTSGIRIDRGTAVGSPGSVNPPAIIHWDENAGQWEIGVEGNLGKVLTGAHTHSSAEVLDFSARTTTEMGLNDLNAIQDVTYLVAPVDRDHLVFNFGTGQWENSVFATDVTAELNVNDLEQMQDVTSAGAAAGEILMWGGSPASWTNHLPIKADISDFIESDYIHTTGDEVKTGNLTIDGNFTTLAGASSETRLKSEHVYITDTVVTLNADETVDGGGGSLVGGIEIKRGPTFQNALLRWDESGGGWFMTEGTGAVLTTTQIENVGHTHLLTNITDVSATFTEVNYLTGTLSNVQTQIDSRISRTGDTMDALANLTFNVGEVLGLPALPSGDDAAASKKYVDDQNIAIAGAHIADMTVHLEADQNTFLDGLILGGSPGPLLTSSDVNELIGISGNVQTLLDTKADKTGAPATTGNFAMLDASGNLADSLIIVNDSAISTATIWTSTKIDATVTSKVIPALNGNLAGLSTPDGDLVDSGLILNDSGSLVSEIWSAQKIDGVKASKIAPGATNNLASLAVDGQLQDAGALINDAAASAIGIMWTSNKIDTLKADKIVPGLPSNLAGLDAAGNLEDSGVIVNDSGTGTGVVWTADKIDTDYTAKVVGVQGNFVEFDLLGDIIDNGNNPATFSSAVHSHVASDVTDFDTAVDAYITSAAVLTDMFDVAAPAPAALDVLQRNAGNTAWVNESVFTVFGTDFVRSSGSVAESITGVKTFNDDAAFGGSIVVTGDLTVNGTTTTLDSVNLEVTDKNITVNSGYSGITSGSTGSGIHVNRNETGTIGSPPLPVQDLATLIWDDGLLKWKGGLDGAEEVLATEGSSVAQPFWELVQAPPASGSPALPQLVYTLGFGVPTPVDVQHTGLQVFVNGVKQIEGAGKSYTVNYGNPSAAEVTFTSALAAPTPTADVEFYGFGYIA